MSANYLFSSVLIKPRDIKYQENTSLSVLEVSQEGCLEDFAKCGSIKEYAWEQ
jgi:hypothetical protein